MGLGEFDCEFVIVVSEFSFGECGEKETSESPHFPFSSILNANFGYLIMDACCVHNLCLLTNHICSAWLGTTGTCLGFGICIYLHTWCLDFDSCGAFELVN